MNDHVHRWISELDISLHKEAKLLVEIDNARKSPDYRDDKILKEFKDDIGDDIKDNEKRELDSIDVLRKTFGRFFGMRKDVNGKKITADSKATIRKILREYKKKSRQAYRNYLITLKGLKCEV